MEKEYKNLPNDVEKLKEIIKNTQSKLAESNSQLTNTQSQLLKSESQLSKSESQLLKSEVKLEKSEKKYTLLLELTRLLKLKFYGKTSEKLTYPDLFEQLNLFEGIDADYTSEITEDDIEETEIKSHTRKRSGRKPLPQELDRVEVIHDIAQKDKICECGSTLARIGEETSEKLEIEKPRVYVKRHIRPKYACKNCEGLETAGKTVKIASVPPQILPKSIASASVAAHIITGKFVDSLPFYRQEKQFMRYDINISRSTMSIWAFKLYERCYPLEELLFKESRSGPLIQIDETTFQVLDEEGKKASTKSYMWIMRGGHKDRPAIYFRYAKNREGAIAKELLHGYEGAVQSDGYQGYNFLDKKIKITHMGCWAHVRRKFFEVTKIAKTKKPGVADKTLRLISKLYRVEKKIDDTFEANDIYNLRQKESKPVIDQIKELLNKSVSKVPPSTTLGRAIKYNLNQWDRVITYLENGNIPIDNNMAENSIRPFVVGRKNWLFNKSTGGAHASAFFYSITETAKANKIEPFSYLKYLFEKLPLVTDIKEYKLLLPMYIDKEKLK